MRYEVTINGEQKLTVEKKGKDYLVAGMPTEMDIVRLDDRRYHLLVSGKSITGVVVSVDEKNKSMELLLNGMRYHVQIADPLDQLLHSWGMQSKTQQQQQNILAPMPGRVLRILVQEGQQVQSGEALAILEAMKMENIIKCKYSGQVQRIAVREGAAVEKGQTLIELQ